MPMGPLRGGFRPDPNPGPLSAAILFTFGGLLLWFGYATYGEGSIQSWLFLPALGIGLVLLGCNHVWLTIKRRRMKTTTAEPADLPE